MRILLVLFVAFWAGAETPDSRVAMADDAGARPADVDATIARGLAFLGKDAIAWREEHKCVSCHHAGLVVWSMREAQSRGLPVDEPLLKDLNDWIATAGGDGKTGVARPEGIPKALNEKAVNLVLAMGTNPTPDAVSQDSLKRLLQTVKDDQTQSGAWASWPDTRPPIFGNSDERTTASATLALLSAGDGDQAAKAARDKAVSWLNSAKSDDDPQSTALRVVLYARLARPSDEVAPLVERIRRRQNNDGGWSQSSDMPSDAWATGQALYALAAAGAGPHDISIQRGREFLVRSQRDDGSWPMTSRPIKPGDKGATSLIPITAAGSSWAVLGLVRSR